MVTTFLAFKLADPKAIFMTRGNHESKNMNKIYGFEGEVSSSFRVVIYSFTVSLMDTTGMGWDRMGCDWVGWDGVGWDGMG